MRQEELKAKAAFAALEYLDDLQVIGVGTGSTSNYFIEALSKIRSRIDVCVASSKQTEKLLIERGFSVLDLNVVPELPIYIDGADELTKARQLIKGGGGAQTREKILASVAKQFIVIADASKLKPRLGSFPIAVEVLPMARSYVGRELLKLGGNPVYREGFLTDNGNRILDLYDLPLFEPMAMESVIKSIPGVVEHGLFAKRMADKVLLATEQGLETF